MELMNCSGLCVGYNGRAISQEINFSVSQGDYLCIVGGNGAGKSTLMRTLLGLQLPVSGEIQLMNGLRRTEIGYLPQQNAIQRSFPATVEEVVVSGFLSRSGMRPVYTRQERAGAQANMEKVGILGLKRRSYRALSGGQQQRVLLARALCAAGRMLLLDEPVTGLDPEAAMDMYAAVRELNRREGLAVIMISHDIQASVREASHILHMAAQPRFFGRTQEYVKSPVGRLYLEAEGGDNA